MKLKQYLNESLESKIQKITDKICKQYNVLSVPVKFSNKQLSGGSAYYASTHLKGGKIYTPVNITIGEWAAVKKYPDEWIHIFAHELAHHVLAQTKSSLSHNTLHGQLTDKLEAQLSKLTSPPDPKRLAKEKYWKTNKEELIAAHGLESYNKQMDAFKQ